MTHVENPKVHIEMGDARELLLTSSHRYSLVMSEPSNPYRAGVASLFTRNYYEAIRARLDDDGLFLQWLQGYEVDSRTVRTVYATLGSVFPEVETWELDNEDLLLVASKTPDRARPRAHGKPGCARSRTGAPAVLPGVRRASRAFSRISSPRAGLARKVAEETATASTPTTLNVVEFGFARTIGSRLADFAIEDVRRVAPRAGGGPPRAPRRHGRLGPASTRRGSYTTLGRQRTAVEFERRLPGGEPTASRRCGPSTAATRQGSWASGTRRPRSLAAGPTRRCSGWRWRRSQRDGPQYAEAIQPFEPAEMDAIVAHLRARQGRLEEATAALESLFMAPARGTRGRCTAS